jgi:homogentisate 1,2-dioxygenase
VVAARLGIYYMSGVGNRVVARPWFARAWRLLEGEGDCIERAQVAIADVACNADDPTMLRERADIALAIARKLHDVALEAKALADSGLALVELGEVADGLARLDEAIALITGGEIRDRVLAAQSCCAFLSACYYAGDFGRVADPVYVVDAQADQLVYVHAGGGTLRTMLGDVAFARGDYVFGPRGLLHRFVPDGGPQHWLTLELSGGVHVPKQWRNDVGQLRMDAPYSHRDFKRPQLRAPDDEGLRHVVVRRDDRWHGFRLDASPLDVVGWDGTVYPWAFPILAFQPRVSSVHLPPTWHGTFAARGALICSFVPRPVDFAPDAIPCRYPHSSTHCDEIIFYCDGNFTSRRGVGPGSISHHPMGIPHGPHPGAYEASIGTKQTSELAVMLDTFQTLRATREALPIEDGGYMESFA